MPRTRPDWEQRLGRRLKLRDLHILSAVVRLGSMAKAAAHLSMSQPAVSESVASLEEVFGVRLLDRSARGVEANRFAHALLERERVVFDELMQAVREIEFLANPTAGEVRVACGDTLAAGLLPAVIERLSLRHPGIVVRVVQANATNEFRDLRERAVDLALARIPSSFAEADLDAEMLFEDPHRVIVGKSSPWAGRRRMSLAQLAGEPWIFASGKVVRDMLAEAFAAQGLALPKECVSASSILLRNHLLATGRFLTVLPLSVLRYNARPWSLKALPVDLGVKPRLVAMVTLKHRALNPVAGLFAQHVRAVAKAMSAGSQPEAAGAEQVRKRKGPGRKHARAPA